ncbi:MAG TPA: lactate utilization protein [Candidatus Paceibacterota bacterium]|nr:lactate utilization protein [Candidatus Paceibacterota bacterium]
MNYTTLAAAEIISKTMEGLKARNIESEVVNTKEEALAKIKELVPAGASVMNGASVTLEEIGLIDYLKSDTHGWNNLHAGIVAEKDPAKQAQLRKEANLSDYYFGSVHAITEEGEMVIASNTGSQLPHLVFTSSNLILVVGTQKIVPTLADALNRLEMHVIPLEDKHMQSLYGVGTHKNKTLIFHGESSLTKRSVKVLFVKEPVGF